MIDHVIIKFYDIIIIFLLYANFDKYVGIRDYGFIDKKTTS